MFLLFQMHAKKPGFIIADVMAFLPIWSCCFGIFEKHASNAEIEEHFAIMKRPNARNERFTEAQIKLHLSEMVSSFFF